MYIYRTKRSRGQRSRPDGTVCRIHRWLHPPPKEGRKEGTHVPNKQTQITQDKTRQDKTRQDKTTVDDTAWHWTPNREDNKGNKI
jgi:hypothetical protein